MSVNKNSIHYKNYYAHISENKKEKGAVGAVYDLIDDISDRRGFKQAWEELDGNIQDEIIEKWASIIKSNI